LCLYKEPIEVFVNPVRLPAIKILEQSPQVGIVRLIFEVQASTIVEIGDELAGEALAKILNRSRHFTLHNLLILLYFVPCIQALPRQRPAEEIHKEISDSLKVISATRLNA